MKKLYRKGTVHPSPPVATDCLSFLPAAILTLATALTPEDKEVLAYLICCSDTNFPNFSTHRKNAPKNSTKSSASSGGGGRSGHDHPPLFSCDCFRCYMSYWVRWDSSPNRQLIHEIIDAYEDGLAQGTNKKGKKERRKKNGGDDGSGGLRRQELSLRKEELGKLESVEDSSGSGGGGSGDGEVCLDNGEEEGDKGSVRKFVSFIGESIWGVWG